MNFTMRNVNATDSKEWKILKHLDAKSELEYKRAKLNFIFIGALVAVYATVVIIENAKKENFKEESTLQ